MADDSALNGAFIDPSDAQEVIRVLGGIRPLPRSWVFL